MTKTYKHLMEEARQTIPEVTVEEVKHRGERGEHWTLLDVREREEYRADHLEEALSLPRGFLELRVEDTVPDKSTPLIAYCASGVRSLMAARTLKDMGYENVVFWPAAIPPGKMPGTAGWRTGSSHPRSSRAMRGISPCLKWGKQGRPSCWMGESSALAQVVWASL